MCIRDSPKPNRPPPFIPEGPHQVSPETNIDWTIGDWDYSTEWQLRQARNRMIKAQLLEGKSACYRSSGGSLSPRVCSGDMTTYVPVTEECEVQEDDIVFCEVQPGDRFNAQLVLSIDEGTAAPDGKKTYWIGNAKRHMNGWCYIGHIHGRMVECIH